MAEEVPCSTVQHACIAAWLRGRRKSNALTPRVLSLVAVRTPGTRVHPSLAPNLHLILSSCDLRPLPPCSRPAALFPQILGSTSRRSPEELAELCETGTTLGSLTAEQAKDLMDPSSIKRLEYLIGMLRCAREVWCVGADSGRGI